MTRRHELDWYRVLLFALLVPFHVGLGFVDTGLNTYQFLNDDLAGEGMLLFFYWSHSWRIPSLFLISGIGMWFLTSKGATARFMGHRLLRLLVPLVFGTACLNPFAGYVIGVMSIEGLTVSEFLTAYYTRPAPWQIMHLWFLLNLAVYTLLCWPIFALRDRIQGVMPAPIVTLTALVAVSALTLVLLKPHFEAVRGQTHQFAFYLMFFVGGYLIGADQDRIMAMLKRMAWRLTAGAGLVFAVQTALLLVVMKTDVDTAILLRTGGWVPAGLVPAHAAVYLVIEAVTAWAWCLAALGLACRYLARPHRYLTELNDAVYPIYVLHFPVTLVCLALAVQVSAPWWIAFPAVTVIVYIVTWVLWRGIARLGRVAYLVGGKVQKYSTPQV
ncbi:MAG: acyltransferase family protein [Marivita sp.]|uniref:acyltransferase family protein n=1 Tax=Marivita sp. TaxID=2003365 RepID=UPI003EF8A097